MSDNFLVIRIHPDSPVDGATFSTYLDGLQIKVYLAGTYPGTPTNPPVLLGETSINSSSLNLVGIPWMSNTYVASVSKLSTSPTAPSGTTLSVDHADGIAFGSTVVCPSDSKMFSGNASVTSIPKPMSSNSTPLGLSQGFQNFAAAQTVFTFYFTYEPGGNPPSVTSTWTGSNPSFSFDLKVKGKVTSSPTLKFDHTDGIAVGMMMTSGSGVPANTTVIAVPDGNSITLSNNVDLADKATVTFQSNLSSGIMQHVEPVSQSTIFSSVYVPIPASVATAIIPLTTSVPAPPANSFLDVTVVATRNDVSIPINNDFYDVIVSPGPAPTPDQYQSQPQQNTSLYLTLPPPPNPNAIDLIIPTDGTAPSFDALYNAMNQAITNDTNFPAGTTLDNLSPTDCLRMAYDIVWSQQGNRLPTPPDALESLYTNPPNPGGSTGDSGNTNNLEQDRQKFEGTISSFYATRNATAERLTKFVAAASTALFCENMSLNSKAALLEFPVDPASNFAASVESELLLNGVNLNGTGGVNFGVPAAYFYAVGASLDKSTTAVQRFQLATGDSIERLLQVFSAAEQAGSISDVESFKMGVSANTSIDCPSGNVLTFIATQGIQPNMAVSGANIPVGTTVQTVTATTVVLSVSVSGDVPADSEITFLTQASITSFQAARRLAALGVSAASNSPSVPVYAGTLLAKLVSDWLAQTAPTPTNPPLTYGVTDFNIWSQTLASADPTGYLFLDLDTLTQGYLIPPFTASPTQPANAGQTTLTFAGTSIGIGVGMPVSGTNIAPATVVTKVETVTTVTIMISKPLRGAVTTATAITFNSGSSPITATPNANIAGGSTLTFSGTSSTEGITPGMSVSGTNIAPGTTVQTSGTSTTITVTLSAAVTGAVATTDILTFNSTVPPITATTSVDCPSGNMLTFAATTGVQRNMSVSGVNPVSGTNIAIPAGTTVQHVTATTVTLNGPVAGDVPAGSQITFLTVTTYLSDLVPVTVATTVDTPGGATLTVAATNGILPGMSVFGIGIAAGTRVESVTATAVMLSQAIAADVPIHSVMTFVPLASSLAEQIAAWLPTTTTPPTPNPTVETLKGVTAAQWTSFFTYTGNASWLPPFTQPIAPGVSPGQVTHKAGYVAMRIRAFIRAVQQFFSVSSVATAAQLPAIGAPPLFDLPVPSNDPILEAAGYLSTISGTTFTFGMAISPSDLATAVQDVFPNDPAAQAWLMQAMMAINDLFTVASVIPAIAGITLPNPVSLPFSIAEALYARGFRSASDISRLSGSDFQQALTGTIAYDYAASLQAKAQALAPAPTPGGTGNGGTFHPINPDGSLVNCVPPPCLSPTGPIAYLQEMLNLSQASTCDTPFASPGDRHTTLGDAISVRRGPVGNLLASCANLETPLPTIDIVNECLEFLGTAPATVAGTIYDTSGDELAGYALCDDAGKRTDRDCHDPVALYAALPEYSTPATPIKKAQGVEPLVYNNLRTDFSSCDLPYSQALDVSRTYLQHFGSCRFEEMRTFRKCITEFALYPTNPPTGFQSFLWRYPVRIDIAIEYLGITPEEYTILFHGTVPPACGQQRDDTHPQPTGQGAAPQLFGFSPVQAREISDSGVVPLPLFLGATCLSYCEFVELAKSGVPIDVVGPQGDGNNLDRKSAGVPECEPCCLGDYHIQLPSEGRQATLQQLAVFIPLWRKLKGLCGARYTFAQLYDICTVLKLFNGASPNPEFIRQLAAFQMLRDQFHLPLDDPKQETAGATGADRTHVLALWAPSAKMWGWALHHLLEGIETHARARYGCPRERQEQIAHMADHLDALSRLAGFNPGTADVWNANPGCTLRFTEVLAKLCASEFRISEVLYLFNTDSPPHAEHPFPLQDPDDALAYPLEVPEGSGQYSLWKLREELLKVEVCEDEWRCLSWTKIVDEFRRHFGYAPPAGQDPLFSLGQHFFPCALEESGFSISAKQRQYRTTLASTSAWNSPPGSPFQYDTSALELWVQLPLNDEAVAAKLGSLPPLNPAEQAAAQDLYFAPRLDLAFVAFLFPDWQAAEIHLIQEYEERNRWHWFQRHFALANARRKIIAAHVAKHVAHRTGCSAEDLHAVAGLVLSRLYADENTGTPWDSDNGVPPTVMWGPPPAGGAIPALLGLLGTGLLGEYEIPHPAASNVDAALQVIWRDVRDPMQAFGHERDATNSAVPTILPPLTLSNTANPLVTVTNGYAVKTSDGQRLGGAASILVRWSGSMLVEREGEYHFHAGAPTPDSEKPDFELAETSQWRVTLQRGSKSFAVLNHEWPGNTEPDVREPCLRRGAYRITVEYSQPAPDLSTSHPHRKRTGFQVKYAGPDTEDCLVTLPVHRLYREYQDHTLDHGIAFLPGSKNAQAFLKAFYTSTLRDMRRTYQRAFKTVLFAGKLDLSARRGEAHQSELGYMLANPANFSGYAYYRTSPTTFTQHLVNFDFNFLPVKDNYHPPAADARTAPSLQHTQAMFDWWERLFDYTVVRKQAHRRCKGPLWQMFEEGVVNPPGDPAHLLRHIGAEHKYWALDLRYYQDQWNAMYSVSDVDLQDDRWLVRVWHADQWIRCLMERFHAKDISKARPDLWASDDPSAPVPASGVTQTGNANLLAFVNDACVEEHPRRYADVKRLNDGLRERGRKALISYLCKQNRVPLPWASSTYAMKPADLSDLLLLDVETGMCEKASRIEEAISAVQTFIRRSRLGLEPNWTISGEFIRLWDSRFDTYRLWEKCKRRELYRENWIDWSERGKARRIEAFRFLESELRKATLTVAAPGGLDWWQDDVRPLEQAPMLIQKKVPSELEPLTTPPQSTPREGFATLGSPAYAARPTWLAAVPQSSAATGGGAAGGGASVPTLTPARSVPALAKAAADGSAQPVSLPLWMESAMKLGTRFLRIAAAGVPQASLGFKPHGDEPRTVCCRECGCDHPVLIDEYYFWLEDTQYYAYTDQTDAQSSPDISFAGSYQFGFQDSYYDAFQLQSAEWHDEDRVPALLAKWQPNPAVRLAWCRMHNGQFGQPRKSNDYIAISGPADLIFLGRGGDSLYFQVTGSAPLPPGYGGDDGDPSPPGFRYDLPSDESVRIPQAIKPPALPTSSPYPGGLLSYPFFAYHDAGARLFPNSWFAPSMAVAEALRARCGFELALKWYRRAFDPLNSDCTWMVCKEKVKQPSLSTDEIAKQAYLIWEQHGRPPAEEKEDWFEAEAKLKASPTAVATPGRESSQPGACCDSTQVTEEVTRDRAVTLQFCHTLVEWADAIMHHQHSPEAFQQARLLYDTVAKITGCTPQTILLPKPVSPPPVKTFTAANPPLNPRLIDLYSLVSDRLGLIRSCYDARRLRNGRPDCDLPYWGDDPLREGWRTVQETCADEAEWCHRGSPYRFVFQIQKAQEMVGRVRELGAALLAAYEKGDAEALASIRAGQERDMATLGITIRQDQWRDADWQVQALQQTKEVNQTNLLYYTTLYQNDLINDEIQNLNLTTNAMLTRTGASLVSAVGEVFHILPDPHVGAMSTFMKLPVGDKMAFMFDTIAKIMQTVADIQSTTASMDLTQAGWQRRSAEWFHQMQTLPIEIQQIELQILGAQRQRDQALQELNNQQRQIENAAEVLDFLRDKFTATDLYLFLQKDTSALYRTMYEMAHRAADEAQRAFNFERGHTTRRFIPEEIWDNLHEGLMAGERLDIALRHMEKAYLDENVREYELTKHFSLCYHFPMEFLRIKETGCCEIKLPEWMFDLDYPGQYMRRIKNVTLTIPCVTGPYNGVHCRMMLLSSVTRIDPRLELPAIRCCSECGSGHGYEACPHDPRMVRSYAAREAIATSSGQNDSGMFELNFRDERYLPFEFQGAVSHWRIELPPKNNYFDMDTLSDVIVNLNYTSREGGGLLRQAAMEAAQKHLPGDGWCFFDVRHEFPDGWQMLRNSCRGEGHNARLKLRIERKMFPFLPGSDEVSITRIALLFHARSHGHNCPKTDNCRCQCERDPDDRVLEFACGDHHRHDHPTRVSCMRSEEWPDLYYGVVETKIGPVGKRGNQPEIEFRFPHDTGEVETVYLLCHYKR
jgi:hypothetical protein